MRGVTNHQATVAISTVKVGPGSITWVDENLRAHTFGIQTGSHVVRPLGKGGK